MDPATFLVYLITAVSTHVAQQMQAQPEGGQSGSSQRGVTRVRLPAPEGRASERGVFSGNAPGKLNGF